MLLVGHHPSTSAVTCLLRAHCQRRFLTPDLTSNIILLPPWLLAAHAQAFFVIPEELSGLPFLCPWCSPRSEGPGKLFPTSSHTSQV